MGSRGVICAVFTVAAVISACGGIDEPDLFSSGGSSSGAGDAGSGSSKDSGSGATSDGGTGGGRDSGGGGGGSDAGGDKDSGGGGGSDPGIYCASGGTSSPVYCTGGDICCARNNTLGSGLATFACGSEGDCTGDALGDLAISCDDAHDCGGDICCGTFVAGTTPYYSDVSCQSSCESSDERIFCDPAKGNADCVNGGSCVESGSMPGFHVCG